MFSVDEYLCGVSLPCSEAAEIPSVVAETAGERGWVEKEEWTEVGMK